MSSIRLVTLDDAPALAELCRRNRDFLAPWEPERDDDFYSVEGQLSGLRESLARHDEGSAYPHVILDDSGMIIGRISIENVVRRVFQSCTVGYWVGEQANGSGVGSAALRAVTAIAFDDLGLHRIEAGTLTHNVRSQRVLEKNGFVRFGLAPAYLKIAGVWQDHVLYQALNPRQSDRLPQPVPHARTTARRRDDVREPELVGGVERRDLFLSEHDPGWASTYLDHEARIRAALGPAAVAVEHIGSTSVDGLAAKPIIDILLTVPDVTAEEDYLEPLLASGYVLRVREPGHRLVRTEERDVHVHVLEPDDPAVGDYLLLRDHLRADADDRRLYETTKRELLTREWSDMNAYSDAKTDVIEQIKRRARGRTA